MSIKLAAVDVCWNKQMEQCPKCMLPSFQSSLSKELTYERQIKKLVVLHLRQNARTVLPSKPGTIINKFVMQLILDVKLTWAHSYVMQLKHFVVVLILPVKPALELISRIVFDLLAVNLMILLVKVEQMEFSKQNLLPINCKNLWLHRYRSMELCPKIMLSWYSLSSMRWRW